MLVLQAQIEERMVHTIEKKFDSKDIASHHNALFACQWMVHVTVHGLIISWDSGMKGCYFN